MNQNVNDGSIKFARYIGDIGNIGISENTLSIYNNLNTLYINTGIKSRHRRGILV